VSWNNQDYPLPAWLDQAGHDEAAMETELDLFHFEEDRPSFESYSQENGFKFWLASDLMVCLNYQTWAPMNNAVNNAIAACAALNIPITGSFQETTTNGRKDWKLSRFACYLTVMNADPRNPRVAEAQAYFITMAEAFRQYVQEADGVERVIIRGEVSDREKSLGGVAKSHGVQNYAFFQNAGYRGLYNMNLADIRARKHVPTGRSPLDFMGKTELAANLFRITQTEEKIRNDNVTGQIPLERVAEQTGKTVRRTMIEISGTAPEHLPAEADIDVVRKGLKRSQKEYQKLDTPGSSNE